MKAWTIKQLAEAMQRDLAACNTAFERSMVAAIAGREIREMAALWAQERKLTPLEVAIAEQHGYRGQV